MNKKQGGLPFPVKDVLLDRVLSGRGGDGDAMTAQSSCQLGPTGSPRNRNPGRLKRPG
jgi:hypothetical protein